MAEGNKNGGASEALQKGAQAASMVKGAVKAGKAIAGAAKGAAAGGPYGAVAGFVWGNRKMIGKIIIAVTAFLMIPIMIICMLPALIFGGLVNAFSPQNPDVPVLNDNAAVMQNVTDISTAIGGVLSEALDDVLKNIDKDFSSSGAQQKEIINPHANSPFYNSNAFVSQYCAAKDKDFESLALSDMKGILTRNKDKLYSYTKKVENRTVTKQTVTVSNGKEIVTETTVTEKWAVYTITYNGETYFADNVFHLNAEQKTLADNYSQNLSLFLGDSMFQGVPDSYETMTPLGNIRFTDGVTEVVYFNQRDEIYAKKPYGTDDIGGYGCGPTAMSIVVSSLTNDIVDPVEMANWSYEHGYWASGNGSYRTLIPGAAKAWNLSVEGCSAAEGQKIVDALGKGKLVVAIMSKGHFTTSGHFIVLRGVKDGKILVADPASYTRSQKEWDLSIILDEASKLDAAGGPFWIIG